MPVAIPIIAVAVGAVASAAVGGGIIGALVGAGTAFAITSAGNAVFPTRPPSAPVIPARAVDNTTAPGAGRTQSVRQPLTEHQIVFGRCKVGGPIVFIHSATDDQGRADGYFYAVVVLAAHRVQSISDVWLGDTLATDAKFPQLAAFVTGLQHLLNLAISRTRNLDRHMQRHPARFDRRDQSVLPLIQ